MTVYHEGDGNPRPIKVGEARDIFVHALREMRDEALNDPYLDQYEDSAQRDTAVANKIIGGVLGVLDGNSTHFPGVNLIAYETQEDKDEAIAAGGNYFDATEFSDFGGGMKEYWELVHS